MRKTVLISAALITLAMTALAQGNQPKPPGYKLPDKATFTAVEVKISRPGDGSQTREKEGQTKAERAKAEPAFDIAATLSIPKEDTHGKGPYPAVFFISGSGMQDRHGFQGNLDIGTWEILDAVANAGFVVLRADDRTTGGTPLGFKGFDHLELGYHALVGDARACVRYLRERPEVDKSKLFLIGHSEGGLTAPLLASEADLGVAGIICLAGPGRNLRAVIRDQVEAANAGLSELARTINMAIQDALTEAIKNGVEPDYKKVPKEMWERPDVVAGRKWMRDHFNIDVAALHSSLRCPVFVAQGAADFQVNPVKDAKALAAALAKGDCKDVTLRIYDDLDHLFKPCGRRPSTLEMYFEKRAVDKVFINDVVDWLKRHAR